jgi:hypothetical protein
VRALGLVPWLAEWPALHGVQPPSVLALASLALFGNAILAPFVWVAWIEPFGKRWLLRHGVAVRGEIVGKDVSDLTEPASYYARYVYGVTSGGASTPARYDGSMQCDVFAFASTEVGAAVTVLYDPRDPRRSTVYELSDYRVPGFVVKGRDGARVAG